MFIDSIFAKTIRPRFFGVALTVAFLGAASAAQAQTVSADFGGRSGTTPAVPSGILSVGGVGSSLSDSNAISALTTAGLNETRFWINLDSINATSTPNFSALDRSLRTMQNTGVHPLGVIHGTPKSLGGSSCAPPSDTWRWGQMAASVVAHVNQTFPGVMRDYEIWNEPELPNSLCAADDAARLKSYLSMFAAAGSAMHAQAKNDGQPIRIGGPVISQVAKAPIWVTGILTNPSTAPYVDFVSFHLYITGQKEIDSGMNWSQLYTITQSSTRGIAHYYHLVEPLVRAGHQPNAASTPIYISEFNDNWAFDVECCRNNQTYGPLWNSLVITDLLNTVYSGAKAVPSQLSYFNATGKFFCIMGQWDAGMDCNPASGVKDPYPQFYAYKLFASSQYLDLQKGGHMAASVSPASTTSGLSATAFYTASADSVVVINPTSTSYNAVSVAVKNPGLTSATGTVYVLDSANGQISTESVALTAVTGGYTAKVAAPAYSTVALSVKGSPGTPTAPPPVSTDGPTAVLSVTPNTATHPAVVNVDSSRSTGGGSSIVGRTINFGDGSWLSWSPTASHSYAKAGSYKVNVIIKNKAGQMSTASAVVTVK